MESFDARVGGAFFSLWQVVSEDVWYVPMGGFCVQAVCACLAQAQLNSLSNCGDACMLYPRVRWLIELFPFLSPKEKKSTSRPVLVAIFLPSSSD